MFSLRPRLARGLSSAVVGAQEIGAGAFQVGLGIGSRVVIKIGGAGIPPRSMTYSIEFDSQLNLKSAAPFTLNNAWLMAYSSKIPSS